MNALEAGGDCCSETPRPWTVWEKRHTALCWLTSEKSGTVRLSVRFGCVWKMDGCLHSVPNRCWFLTFANFRFQKFFSELIWNPSWRLLRRRTSPQRTRKPMQASSWAGENRFMIWIRVAPVSSLVQLTSDQGFVDKGVKVTRLIPCRQSSFGS